MKIALAQINPVVGDFRGNLERIELALAEAMDKGASLCVFPEMATCGCYANDLLLEDRFVSDNLDLIDRLAAKTHGIGIVIGFVRWSPSRGGLENAAAVISNGEIVSTHVKCRLGQHGELDESRYFVAGETATPVTFEGFRFGITLSNDIWGDFTAGVGSQGKRDPVSEAVQKGAEVILNLSAEPYRINGCEERLNALKACANAHHRPVLHVNMVGGNGEWVFDGAAVAVDPNGDVVTAAMPFRESVTVVDIESDADPLTKAPCEEIRDIGAALTLGTRDFFLKQSASEAVVVLDGGFDSELAAVIAADALGATRVKGLLLVTDTSDEEALSRAESLARHLGISTARTDAASWTRSFGAEVAKLVTRSVVRHPDNLDLTGGIAARSLLLTACRLNGDRLICSDTRTDLALFAPFPIIGDFALFKWVSKSRLWEIGAQLRMERNFPKETLIPTAVEKMCRFDVDGAVEAMSYATVDLLLDNYFALGYPHLGLFSFGLDEAVVRAILRNIASSEAYRRRLPPGINIGGTNRPKIPLQHRFGAS